MLSFSCRKAEGVPGCPSKDHGQGAAAEAQSQGGQQQESQNGNTHHPPTNPSFPPLPSILADTEKHEVINCL